MSNIAGGDRLALTAVGGEVARVAFGGRLQVDHGLAAREALLADMGIASAHLWLIDDLLQTGAVERVLPDYEPDPVPLSILAVPGRLQLRRVRLLVDEIAERLKMLPGIE